MIYTGYAGSAALLFYYQFICNLQPVIISGGRIHGYHHIKDSKYCKDLAPVLKWWWPWHCATHDNNKKIAYKWYEKYYINNILNRKTPVVLYNELIKFGNGKDIILCCVGEEQEYLFCHRHIIQNWFKNSGIQVAEFPHPNQYLLIPIKCK